MIHRVTFEYEVSEELKQLYREESSLQSAKDVFEQPINNLRLVENQIEIVESELIEE